MEDNWIIYLKDQQQIMKTHWPSKVSKIGLNQYFHSWLYTKFWWKTINRLIITKVANSNQLEREEDSNWAKLLWQILNHKQKWYLPKWK